MRMVEKKVTYAQGLNEAARKLNVSRGHLSLVVHGKRESRRLVARMVKELGWKPGDLPVFKVEHGTARVRV